jgi:hypothetical protein
MSVFCQERASVVKAVTLVLQNEEIFYEKDDCNGDEKTLENSTRHLLQTTPSSNRKEEIKPPAHYTR